MSEYLSEKKFFIENLFKNHTNNTFIQLFRYTLVGGTAYLVDFSSLFFITEFLNVHYLLSAAVGFLLGLIVNYTFSIFWVFSRRKIKKKGCEFGIFALIGIIGLGFNELSIWFFTEYFYFHYLASKIIATGFILLWNFFARKFFLF